MRLQEAEIFKCHKPRQGTGIRPEPEILHQIQSIPTLTCMRQKAENRMETEASMKIAGLEAA